VLEGSVRKAANQVRITAQLADTQSGAELRAQSYDRPLRDVFSTQDEIVHKILTTLQLQLALSQSGIPMFPFPHGTNNIEAYDYFLRSIGPYFTETREGVTKSCEMDERALALDPKYVDAMWGLGFCYVTGVILGYTQNPARDMQIASDLARKALALDDASPEAYYLLSSINWVQGRDFENVEAARRHYVQAMGYAKRGIELEPSNPFGYQRLADALIALGQPTEGVEAAKKAMRLDPIGSEWYTPELGWGYTSMGRFNDAIPVLTRAVIRHPENVGLHLLLTICYSETDQKERARAEAAEVLRINPNFSLKMLHAGPGDRNFSHALADWREAGLN
jgi:adenylate cyclase